MDKEKFQKSISERMEFAKVIDLVFDSENNGVKYTALVDKNLSEDEVISSASKIIAHNLDNVIIRNLAAIAGERDVTTSWKDNNSDIYRESKTQLPQQR